MGNVNIRTMTSVDVCAVADIHTDALPDDLLPRLGRSFLAKNYYASILKSKYSTVIVAELDNRIVGFVNLSFNATKHAIWFLLTNLPSLLISSVRLCFKDRTFIFNMLFSFLNNAAVDIPKGAAEISFIAVDPSCHGKGVGKKLVEESNKTALQRGISQLFTKTLSSNIHVQNMYIKGWGARIVSTVKIGAKEYVYISWEPPRLQN